MRRIYLSAVFALALFLTCIADTTAQSTGRINRVELFAGYSHNRVDTTLDSDDFDEGEEFGGRVGTNGVNVSLTGNVSKYVGFKFDFAHHQKTENFLFEGFDIRQRYTNNTFMGGVQIKNNAKDGPRVKPFGHVLAGVSRQRIAVTEPTEPFEFEFAQSNFTFAVGGGVDVRVTRRVDIRAFQFDYNPTYFKDQEFEEFELNGRLQNNYRFSFGIVIH